MIISFKCEETRKIYQREISSKFPYSICHTAMRKLWVLDAAINLNDLRVPPGNRLEKLKGDRKGQWSIRINDKFRICFNWNNGAYNVEITDYH